MEQTTRTPATITVGALRDMLAAYDAETPIIVATDEWYLNIRYVEFNPADDDIAVTIETRDDFDTRQW